MAMHLPRAPESPCLELYKMSDHFGNSARAGIPAFVLPELVQPLKSEEGITLPTYLSSFSTEERNLQIKLEEISNLPRLQYLDGTRTHAWCELLWLRDHERRLHPRLGYISFKLADSDGIGWLDMDHLSGW